jgi:hypothetical protein
LLEHRHVCCQGANRTTVWLASTAALDPQPTLSLPKRVFKPDPAILVGARLSSRPDESWDAFPKLIVFKLAIGLAGGLANSRKHAIDEGLAFRVSLKGPLVLPK